MPKSYARAQVSLPSSAESQQEAHARAFKDAVREFFEEHGREPDWDRVNFKGGHMTSVVVIEIWEEEL